MRTATKNFAAGCLGTSIVFAAFYLRKTDAVLEYLEDTPTLGIALAIVAFLIVVGVAGFWACFEDPKHPRVAFAIGLSVPSILFGANLALAGNASAVQPSTGAIARVFLAQASPENRSPLRGVWLVFAPVSTVAEVEREQRDRAFAEKVLQAQEKTGMLSDQVTTLKSRVERSEQARAALQETVTEKEHSIREREAELYLLKTRHHDELRVIKETQEEIEERYRTDMAAATARLDALRQDLDAQREAAEAAATQLEDARQAHATVKAEAERTQRQLELRVEALASRNKSLEKQATTCALALPLIGRHAVAPLLRAATANRAPKQRIAALDALGMLGRMASPAAPELQRIAAEDSDVRIRRAAEGALRQIRSG
ncbi:MAG: hypothetical protein ACYTEZ_18710 [Planctomycetota bacterium]|jgi:hypothetical protein